MKLQPNRLFIAGKMPSRSSYDARCNPFNYSKHVEMFCCIQNATTKQMMHICEELHFFSDGQLNAEKQWHFEMADKKLPLEIICSITTFYQLELLIQVVAVARKKGLIISEISFLYLFGQRSDRIMNGFSVGLSSYFKDVLAPILNSLNAPISFFCPHSWMNIYALEQVVGFEFPFELKIPGTLAYRSLALAADEGEYDRAHPISSTMPNVFHGLTHPFSYYVNIRLMMDGYFKKARHENGAHLSVSLESARYNGAKEIVNQITSNPDAPIMLFDDLCDGGRSHIEAAKWLRGQGVTNPLRLFVAHALFFYRYAEVFEHFDIIVTTNSIQRNTDSEEHDGCPVGDWGCKIDGLESDGKLFVVDVWNYPGLASTFGHTRLEKFGEDSACQTNS